MTRSVLYIYSILYTLYTLYFILILNSTNDAGGVRQTIPTEIQLHR